MAQGKSGTIKPSHVRVGSDVITGAFVVVCTCSLATQQGFRQAYFSTWMQILYIRGRHATDVLPYFGTD